MKKNILSTVFLFCCLISVSQNKIKDSLQLALKNAKHDTTRCNILNALIEDESDDNVWPLYNKQLQRITEKNLANPDLDPALKKIFKKSLGSALNNHGYIEQQQGRMNEAIHDFAECLKIYEQIDHKPGMATCYNNIAFIYQNEGNVANSITYFKKSLKICEDIGNKSGIASALNNLGSMFDKQGNSQKALDIILKA